MNIKRFLALFQFRYLFEACRNDINLVSLHNWALKISWPIFPYSILSLVLPPPFFPFSFCFFVCRICNVKAKDCIGMKANITKMVTMLLSVKTTVGFHFRSLFLQQHKKLVLPYATRIGRDSTCQKVPCLWILRKQVTTMGIKVPCSPFFSKFSNFILPILQQCFKNTCVCPP